MSEAAELARLTAVTPSPRQLRHQALEFYGFLHFGVNTFTNREWGDGTEFPGIFAPDALDARQWVRAMKQAGMRGAILTCKHHDGFCLWPSKYTGHTVKNSSYRGDVVRAVADACEAEGMAFGVYLSPWDRHEATYGQGTPYNDYYMAQLTELLSDYGEIFSVWLDGACGEGANGRRQRYDWARVEETVRRLQPNACLSVCGPDVRWCGNEAGQTRPSEWSVVPASLAQAERVSALSQHSDDASFRSQGIRSQDMDLGSRAALKGAGELIWYPAEVNTSIRPGWFYHPEEDGQVKQPEELWQLYLRAVGGNATLLLNIPPDTHGLLHQEDVRVLSELGQRIRSAFQKPVATGHFTGGTLNLRLPQKKHLRLLQLKEDLTQSQRVEAFEASFLRNGQPACKVEGTTIGYQKLCELNVEADAVEIRITQSRGTAAVQAAVFE